MLKPQRTTHTRPSFWHHIMKGIYEFNLYLNLFFIILFQLDDLMIVVSYVYVASIGFYWPLTLKKD